MRCLHYEITSFLFLKIMNKKLNRFINIAQGSTKVLIRARNEMVKSSFQSAKKLASVYKDASIEAFKLGSNVIKETLKESKVNGKQILESSEEAIRETRQIIKKGKYVDIHEKGDLSIDDLL